MATVLTVGILILSENAGGDGLWEASLLGRSDGTAFMPGPE